MPSALSLDLRKRVIDAVEAGMSQREAARRFAIGKSTVAEWRRLQRERGHLRPGKPGRPPPSPVEGERGFLLGLLADDPNLSIAELRAALAGRGVAVSWTAVQKFLKRHGVKRWRGRRPLKPRRRR